MFERLSVRSQNLLNAVTPLDLGALVEGLLFYQASEVVIDAGGLKQIAEKWSTDGLLALLNSGFATFRFRKNFLGIKTTRDGTSRERYEPIVFELDRERAPELLISRGLEEVLNRRGRTRRVTSQVCRRLVIEEIDSTITVRARADLLDLDYITSVVNKLLNVWTPELTLPSNTRFEVQEVDDGLRVLTNIDFPVVNALYQKKTSSPTLLTPAFLLAHLLSTREMMEDAARSGADMAVDSTQAAIAAIRIDSILANRIANEEKISQFQTFLFNDGRAIREAVNAGQVTFKDVLKLLENASKFKSWLQSQPAEADLLREYYRSATSSTWVDKLPSKTVRWLVFSGAGAALDILGAGGLGTAAGVALGGVDTVFLDRILKGWKPNQFVENAVQPFLRKAKRNLIGRAGADDTGRSDG